VRSTHALIEVVGAAGDEKRHAELPLLQSPGQRECPLAPAPTRPEEVIVREVDVPDAVVRHESPDLSSSSSRNVFGCLAYPWVPPFSLSASAKIFSTSSSEYGSFCVYTALCAVTLSTRDSVIHPRRKASRRKQCSLATAVDLDVSASSGRPSTLNVSKRSTVISRVK